MIFTTPNFKNILCPKFTLFNHNLSKVSSFKYLGHILKDDCSDDLDIERQCRVMYAQGNILLRKFHMCNYSTKLILFRTYCSSLYTAHLW